MPNTTLQPLAAVLLATNLLTGSLLSPLDQDFPAFNLDSQSGRA